ncbi:hypothetical protein [Actinoplanes philippinensis]|uniref:hypothetical protein n=1 Tax=Actinoplanes philippinensis TaxID=35752 RepID=UPI0033D119EE
MSRLPPCCEETPAGQCEQHRQQQRADREALKNRRGGAIRLGGDVVPTRPTRRSSPP